MSKYEEICRLCGSPATKRVIVHVSRVHGLSFEEYREQTGYQGPPEHPETTQKRVEAGKRQFEQEGGKNARSSRLKTLWAMGKPSREDRSRVMTQVWADGRRQRDPLSKLRSDLRARAGDRCEICSISQDQHLEETGRSLSLHHLSYDRVVPLLNDVMLLCDICHTTQHPKSTWTRQNKVYRAVADLLDALDIDLRDPNFQETPRRLGEFLIEHFLLFDSVETTLEGLREAVFPSEYEGIITQTGIQTYGICPHHLQQIEYTVHIGYIPTGLTIGLSKLSRVAKLITQLPLLQEDSTTKLADCLAWLLQTENIAVVLEGKHGCMVGRGVFQRDTVTTTSEMRGFFKEDDRGAKQEFFQIVDRNRRS